MTPTEATSPSGNHVIGEFPREGLSSTLAAIHRAGFGPQTRVIDGARGDLKAQLERAGLREFASVTPPPDAVLVVVTAPGRTAIVTELFAGLGAGSVAVSAPAVAEKQTAFEPSWLGPDIRLGDDAGLASGK